MSRIGKKPVALPKGVEVRESKGEVTVKGPKGELALRLPDLVALKIGPSAVTVERTSEGRRASAMHGLARALVNNMVRGVTEGFEKTLQIEGVGYQARIEGQNLILQVGFCNDIVIPIPKGLNVEIPPKTKNVIVRGADKQLLGQFTANVRRVKPPDSYKGKGVRYMGEVVRRKAGKTQAGATGG